MQTKTGHDNAGYLGKKLLVGDEKSSDKTGRSPVQDEDDRKAGDKPEGVTDNARSSPLMSLAPGIDRNPGDVGEVGGDECKYARGYEGQGTRKECETQSDLGSGSYVQRQYSSFGSHLKDAGPLYEYALSPSIYDHLGVSLMEWIDAIGDLSPLVRAVVAVVVVYVIATVVQWIWRKLLLGYTSTTRTDIDQMLVVQSERPMKATVLVIGFWIGLLDFADLRSVLGDRFELWADRIFYAALLLTLATLVHRVLAILLDWYRNEIAGKTESDLDDTFIALFDSIGRVVIYFIAVTMILNRWQQPITTFLATAGVASLAVAFAAQETLANMIAGFTIMVDRPFRVGDRVELADGLLGDVIAVGLRTTKVLSFDNTVIVLPNKEIAGARVINHSYPDPKVKIRVRVGISYGTDIDRAKEILRQVCLDHPLVLNEPEPGVYFTEFADSSLNLLAICWINDYRDRFQTLDDLLRDTYRRYADAQISIPFPQRDVHLFQHGD